MQFQGDMFKYLWLHLIWEKQHAYASQDTSRNMPRIFILVLK